MKKRVFYTLLIALVFLTGETFAQTFSQTNLTFDNNTLTAQDTGYKNTHPCMADFDGDGDLDLIFGTNKSTLIYYRNDDINTNVGGSDSTLDGTKMVLVSRALIPPLKDSNNIKLYNYIPAAGDVDGDGLIDLFVGTNNGDVYFLKNNGLVDNVPQFDLVERVISSNNKVGAAPFLVDMDGDGDLDLFIGYFKGDVDYYKNTGDATNYNFVLETSDILGSYNTYQSVIPCLYDVNGDNTYDMLLGRKNNTIVYYTGNVSNGEASFTHQTDNWKNLRFDLFVSPNIVDLKNDGSIDLVVGQYNGQIAYYTDTLNTPILITKMFASIDIGYIATPLLFDMDGDGDLDLLVAHQKQIAYLINTGSGNDLNFDVNTLTYITVSQPITSLDVWDYDNDGDLDVFFGTTSGGVGLLKNNGIVNGTVSLSEEYTGYGYNGAVESFDNMVTPNPDAAICIADLDGDGDMDFLIANQYGTSTFYRNEDINTNAGGNDQTLDGWHRGSFVRVKAGYGSGDSYFPFTLPGYNSIKARDLDGDGDFDFLTTGADGKVYKITNTSNATVPSYVKASSPLPSIPQFDDQSTYLIKTKLDIRDFNGDGWYDLVLGGGEGGLKLYVNSGDADTTPPTAPGNFTGQALSDKMIKLTWDISTDLNGTGVKEYILKRYNADSSTLEKTIVINDPVASGYTDTGLTALTNYHYEITAYDFAGNESETSSVDVATQEPPHLDHFEIITPNGVVGSHFTLTIKAISNYGFVLDDFNETANITVSEGEISPQQVSFSHGTVQQEFTYSNDNVNDNIHITITVSYDTVSSTSNPISVDLVPPDTPSLVEATPQSSTKVLLRWGEVHDTGGASNYYIDIYRNGTKIITVSGTSTNYTDTGCQPSTQYTYYLKSRDSVGNVSEASNSMTVETPESEQDTTPPTTPTGLTLVSTGEDFIAFKWNPSTDEGGSGLGGYKIYRGAQLIDTISAAYTSYSDTGLQPDTEYVYHVRAFDNAGNYSDFSEALTAKTKPHEGDTTPPSVPQNLQATALDDTSIKLTWNASTDTGGSGLAGYRIYREDVNNYGTIIKFVDASTTEYVNNNLTPGTTYRYKIKAVDNAGNESGFSNVAEATTPDSSVDTQAPTTPTNVQVIALSPSIAKITWSPSTDNVAVDYYEIYQVLKSNNPFSNYEYTFIGQTSQTQFIKEELSPGETYHFAVRAVDTSGNKSRYSATVEITMPDSSNDHNPPTPPENLRFVQVRHSSVIITYNPATDNESGVKQYHIFRNGGEIAQTDALRYEDTDIQGGETYQYYVKAEDWNGNMSEPSNTISTQIPAQEDNEPPSTPSNLTYIATPDYVILNWGMSYDEISGVDHYEIQRINTPFKAKDSAYATTTDTTFKDENVQVGSKYMYYVSAVDRAGNKSVPATITVVIPQNEEQDNTLYFPHIDVSDMWWTGFAVVNPSNTEAPITIKFYDNSGNEITSLNETIPAKGKLVKTIRNLFNDNVPEGVSWYKIETEKKLDGFELFGTNDWKEMVGVKIFTSPTTTLIYPEVKSDDNLWTGIAIINVSTEEAHITFKAYNSEGSEVAASKSYTIPPNGKMVDLIENLFDNFSQDTAYLIAESDKNIIGFELYGYKSQVGIAGLSAVPFNTEEGDSNGKTKVKGDDSKVLSAVVLSATEVQLTWDAIEPTPDSYRIYQVEVTSTPFGNTINKIQQMAETTDTQYVLTGLTPDTDYQFAVYPVYGDEEGEPTNVVSVHTMAGEPDIIYTYICPRVEEVNGGTTSIAFINTTNSSGNVKLQLLSEGAVVVEEKELTINGLNKFEKNLSEIFSSIPDNAKGVRIVSDKELIVWENFEKNCDNGNNNGYYDTLYGFNKALTTVNFSHIAKQTQWWNSYLCMWNISKNGANTELHVYGEDGSPLGVFPVSILPGDVSDGEVHNYIPDDSILKNIGWIEVSSTEPLNGYFIFSTKDDTALAAVECQ